MLEPSLIPADLVPSAFLPRLPQTRATLQPLSRQILLGHIAVLRELYQPPIHGGFSALDATTYEDEDGVQEDATCQRGRTSGAGLSESMDGLNLDPLSPKVPLPTRYPLTDTLPEDLILPDTEEDEEEEGEVSTAHLDPFERSWAEQWLNGVVRRAQSWLAIREKREDSNPQRDEDMRPADAEAILRDASAVLAMMAGTSAAGSLTRHLLFPVDASFRLALRKLRSKTPVDPALSPETTTFLASLSTSPISPIVPFLRWRDTSRSPEIRRRRTSSTTRSASQVSSSPKTVLSVHDAVPSRGRKRKRPALPILLHDAPMSDHISVGVQTWGSAILLGREIALRPESFGLFTPFEQRSRGIRVLELGAGTGLISILCRKLLDLRAASHDLPAAPEDLVVATDFHPDVLANLRTCIDLNFPPHVTEATEQMIAAGSHITSWSGIHIAKLDWSTFPVYKRDDRPVQSFDDNDAGEEMRKFVNEPFDLVIASDCVYDETHAKMLKDVVRWLLRRPDEKSQDDPGGTFHLISPLRPTFAPELESIDTHFPLLSDLESVRSPQAVNGENIGMIEYQKEVPEQDRLRLGARGDGKRAVKGKRGEGRVDEVGGYWWWEIGWG